MPSILQLPPEVLSMIICLLPGKSIKSLRKTSKRLNDVASPHLYRVLYISCHGLDLEVFNLVTANPLLASGVRELVIDDTAISPSLTDWKTYNWAADCYLSTPRFPMPYHHGPIPQPRPQNSDVCSVGMMQELLRPICRAYRANYDSQADRKALKSALPRLKNLRNLVISNRTADEYQRPGAQSKGSSSPLVQMWRNFATEQEKYVLLPPRCDWRPTWSPMPDSYEKMWQADHIYDNFKNNEYWDGSNPVVTTDGERYGSRVIDVFDAAGIDQIVRIPQRTMAREAHAILMALEAMEDVGLQSKIQQFRVDASDDILDDMYQPGLPIRIFQPDSPLPNCLISKFSLAPNLTSFHLVLCNAYSRFQEGHDAMGRGGVGRVLASMAHLRELVIEVHMLPIMRAIPDNQTWGSLRSVRLECGEMDTKRLVGFLHRHGNTLESVTIDSCYFGSQGAIGKETWDQVAEEITKLQDEGKTHLKDAKLVSTHASYPTGLCGKIDTPYKYASCKKYSWDWSSGRSIECKERAERGIDFSALWAWEMPGHDPAMFHGDPEEAEFHVPIDLRDFYGAANSMLRPSTERMNQLAQNNNEAEGNNTEQERPTSSRLFGLWNRMRRYNDRNDEGGVIISNYIEGSDEEENSSNNFTEFSLRRGDTPYYETQGFYEEEEDIYEEDIYEEDTYEDDSEYKGDNNNEEETNNEAETNN